MENLINETNKYFNASIRIRTRKRNVILARYFYYVIAAKDSGMTYESIGKSVGSYDHSTVSHALKTFESIYYVDLEYREQFEKYIDAMEGQGQKVENTKEFIKTLKTK